MDFLLVILIIVAALWLFDEFARRIVAHTVGDARLFWVCPQCDGVTLMNCASCAHCGRADSHAYAVRSEMYL
jgi:hypothetical protein